MNARVSSFTDVEVALLRVPRVEYVSLSAPASANTPFIVAHSLGVTPTFYSWNANANASVYHTDDDRREWGRTQIKVRCSAANTRLVVKVEAA